MDGLKAAHGQAHRIAAQVPWIVHASLVAFISALLAAERLPDVGKLRRRSRATSLSYINFFHGHHLVTVLKTICGNFEHDFSNDKISGQKAERIPRISGTLYDFAALYPVQDSPN